MVRPLISLTVLMIAIAMSPLLIASQLSPATRLAGAPNGLLRPPTSASECPNPAARIPPPAPIQPADFVELRRTCGDCAQYTVQIRGDGQVHWYQSSLGPAGAADMVNPAEARALLDKLRTNDFWSLCGSYSVEISDGPTMIMTVHIAGQDKRVSDYNSAAPAVLQELENEIDRLVDIHRHLHGDPRLESLASLRMPGVARIGFGVSSHLRDDAYRVKPGLTALMQASAKGDVEEVRRQLSSGQDPNAQDSSGWTALMYATQAERTEATRILLDAGANPNARSYLGQTALMAVSGAYYSAPQKFRLLLAAGADVNLQDNDGHTALMFAMYGALSSADNSATFLQRAELISSMLAAGALTDLRDARGFTALDYLDTEGRLYPQQKVEFDKMRRILVSPQ